MALSSQPCCLIAEDQAIIALALEDDLKEAGIEVAGPFASIAAVLSWLDGHTPELAILDFRLRDGSCTAVAVLLLERGVPVIVYSGWPRETCNAPELSGVTWLEKPVSTGCLLEAVEQIAPACANHGHGPCAGGERPSRSNQNLSWHRPDSGRP